MDAKDTWAFVAIGTALGLVVGWFFGAWPLGGGVGLLAGFGAAYALSC